MKRGVEVDKVLAMLEEGHKKCCGSFYMVLDILTVVQKVSTLSKAGVWVRGWGWAKRFTVLKREGGGGGSAKIFRPI